MLALMPLPSTCDKEYNVSNGVWILISELKAWNATVAVDETAEED